LKWTRRGDDWTRLAEAAQEDYVALQCEKNAEFAYSMADFWGGYA